MEAQPGATKWQPAAKNTAQEAAWNDADTRRQAQRRYIAPILGAILVVLAVVTGLLVWQRMWHIEALAPWLVVLCAGIGVGAAIGTVFGVLAAVRIRKVLRENPWVQHTVRFGAGKQAREVSVEVGRSVEEFRADFPGPALNRLQGATVRLPVCGDGDLRVVGLDLGSRQRARLGILRSSPQKQTSDDAGAHRAA